MEGKSWGILLAAVLLAGFGLSLFLMRDAGRASRAEIRSHGKVLCVVDLNVNQEFTVSNEDGVNVITVRDGKIAVTDADCPDGYCVKRGFCDSGPQIVCLPHALVITFLRANGIDAAVG